MSVAEVVSIVALALAGVLVGAAVPALVQLRRTLRTSERFLETTGRRLERTLDEVADAAGRIGRVGRELEQAAARMRALFDEANALAGTVKSLRGTLESWSALGSALGPAIAAGIRAFSSPEPSPEGDAPVESEEPKKGETS